MKKPFVLIICLLLALALVSCADSGNAEESNNLPPAFSILQKQLSLTKQSEKGVGVSFGKADFESLIGSEISQITLKTLPESSLGTLIFNGKAVVSGQILPADSLGFLKFMPNASTELAVFGFSCDNSYFGDKEIFCNIVFTDSPNSPPIALDSTVKTVEGIPCKTELAIAEPNGDEYTVKVITYPRDGYVTVENGIAIYYPNEDFRGSDTMVYSVTDRFGAVSETATLKIEVAKNESNINFADMQNNLSHLYAHRMCSNNVMVYRYENQSYYFDPEASVSRIEFLVMLMNVTGQDSDIVAVADSIVSDDKGLSSGLMGYLSAAAEKGLIQLENGSFSPKSNITVESAAYMIASALSLPNAFPEGTEDFRLSAMLAASDAGFFAELEPTKAITKAEAAELLCKIEDYMLANNMAK